METVSTVSLLEKISSGFRHSDLAKDPARHKAFDQLIKTGLPGNKSEEYRFTPITQRLEKIFNWEAKLSPSQITSVESFLIAGLRANVIVFVNGQYRKDLSTIISSSDQLQVTKLSQAITGSDSFIKDQYKKITDSLSDPFAVMNQAQWTDGICIRVAEGCKVENPVLLLHIADSSANQSINQTQAFVLLEKGAKLNLIEKFDTTGNAESFHNFAEQIIVNESAELEYCKIQNDEGKSYQVANTAIHQSTGSRVDTFTLTLNGQVIRNNLTINIDGEKCESHFYGLYLLEGNSLVDNHTVVDHKKPNSFSNEMYKGVMDGKSKGVFNGKIFVRPQAQKTNAFQSNRNILMSDAATVNTKPQLEIWADDVKCSHGCTSGQLDEEALFYLRSRGIGEDTAKAMLLYAFAAEVMEPVKNEVLREYLDTLIARRLHKNF